MIKKYTLDFILKILQNNYDTEYLEIKNLVDEERLFKFEEKYLKDLLFHAYKNVPYYTRIFDENGIVKNCDIDLSQFDKIPILTKEIMRKYHQELISKDIKTRRWHYDYSGGSTNEPVRFIRDADSFKWANATGKYYDDILGIDKTNLKTISLWGSERDIFKARINLREKILLWLTNTSYLDSFRMTERDMKKYIEIINSCKPDIIRGYARSLYDLCQYADEKKLTIYTPKIVFSHAETLKDEMRKKIESVFGTKLYDLYGSREVSIVASECKYGLIHIFMFNNFVEILDNRNQPVKDGEEGRVIVTTLHNYSMPLIRYEIGDMAISGPKKCKCGNPLPTLKKISGRITENFIKEDGNIVTGTFFVYLIGIAYNKGFVNKFQVIQEDYKKIKILIVPIGNINNYVKKKINEKIKSVMGKDCKIVWEIVDDIPKTKSGKYLQTISLVWRRQQK